MKKLLLLPSLFISISVYAQEIKEQRPSKYITLDLETGASLIGIGGVKSNGGSYTQTLSPGTAVVPTLQLRVMRVNQLWSYGIRAEVVNWRKKDDFNYTDDKGDPLDVETSTYFASPAISIAPALSRNIVHTVKSDLSAGVYAGISISPHKENGPTSPTVAQDYYLPPSTGFQFGFDLQYRYWVGPRLALNATTGFQQNIMRYNEIDDLGFNLSTIPITAGLSFRF